MLCSALIREGLVVDLQCPTMISTSWPGDPSWQDWDSWLTDRLTDWPVIPFRIHSGPMPCSLLTDSCVGSCHTAAQEQQQYGAGRCFADSQWSKMLAAIGHCQCHYQMLKGCTARCCTARWLWWPCPKPEKWNVHGLHSTARLGFIHAFDLMIALDCHYRVQSSIIIYNII